MNSKADIAGNLIFFLVSLGGITYIYGNKYFLLSTFFTLGISRGMALAMKETKNNAGGTTPYNPLKIPAKKITPIH